jgi:hypothetical protein
MLHGAKRISNLLEQRHGLMPLFGIDYLPTKPSLVCTHTGFLQLLLRLVIQSTTTAYRIQTRVVGTRGLIRTPRNGLRERPFEWC